MKGRQTKAVQLGKTVQGLMCQVTTWLYDIATVTSVRRHHMAYCLSSNKHPDTQDMDPLALGSAQHRQCKQDSPCIQRVLEEDASVEHTILSAIVDLERSHKPCM